MNYLKNNLKNIFLFALLLITVNAVFSQPISDNVIKKNIGEINSPLKSILKLAPKVFEYDTEQFKSFRLKQGKQYGFLADNMHGVFPSMVSSKTVSYMHGKNNYRNRSIPVIDEASLVPVLVAAIKELHQEIEQLKLQMNTLGSLKK